jgi:hypothetical protein
MPVSTKTLYNRGKHVMAKHHLAIANCEFKSRSLCSRLITGQRYTMQTKHNSSAEHAVDVAQSYGSGTWLHP